MRTIRAIVVLALGLCSTAFSPTPSPPPRFDDPSVVLLMNVGGPAIPAIGYVADGPDLLVSPGSFIFKSNSPVTVLGGENNEEVYRTERVSGSTLT